jgi:hypothetical protein
MKKMKKLFIASILLCSMCASAQDDYVIKKDGTKILIRNEVFYYSTFGKLRCYLSSINGMQSQKGIELDEIEKLVTGDITYIPFKESEKRNTELMLYKVVAESDDKILLLAFYPPISPPSYTPDYYLWYEYRIVDKNTSTIVEAGMFCESGLRKKLENQKIAIEAVKKHFSNCKNIMNDLAEFETILPTKSGTGFTDAYIAGFMHQKKLLKCEL